MSGKPTYRDLACPLWARGADLLKAHLAVALNLVVIWKLTDCGNRRIDKPESLFLNSRVSYRLVLSYYEKGRGCDNNLSARRESYWMENASTILANIFAKRFVNERFARHLPRVSVVNSYHHSAYIRAPLPETLGQQEAVFVGRPIDKINAVPERFW